MTTIELSQRQCQKAEGFDQDEFQKQQTQLRQKGRMHWVHWLILCLSVVITLIAWKTSETALSAKERLRFDRETDRVIDLMRDRIGHYEDALLSGVAAMQSHGGTMSRGQWRRYSQHLNLTDRYPGTNGIGVIHFVTTESLPTFIESVQRDSPQFNVHPEHPYDLSLPITYIEPEATNQAAIGLDVAFETNRRSAALFARESGDTQISGPIILVQDSQKTPGVLIYAPYYDPATDADALTDRQRERAFKGLVYAPLIVRKLVEGVLGQEHRTVSLAIRDEETMLYNEISEETQTDSIFQRTESITLHGRI